MPGYTATHGTTFVFDADFAETITIANPEGSVRISGADLLEFVRNCYVIPRREVAGEDPEPDELLIWDLH